MSEPIIKTEKLTKFYDNFEAVHELDLQVQEGCLFGVIGPNGAGKTTTIRMLCGLLRPTSGRAIVNGIDVTRHPRDVKRSVGYMPDFFGAYDRMRVWEYLDFFGAAYRIPRKQRRDRIEKSLELTGATYMRDYFVGSLSKGMRQRAGIAKTLVHDPAVLFLDEPTSGLDPVARIEI
nr:ABC transporter ATP-binding protein [Candidatus Brocadiia bacterium]